MVDLQGKGALVTGAGVRVGRALALALGAHGARVVVHYRRSARQAEETVAAIRAGGSEAVAVAADLAEPDGPARLVEEGAAALGGLDILVNSASLFRRGNLEATTVADWDAHLNTNLRAPFLLAQAFVRQLGERDGAHIINITDWRARRPGKAYLAYIVSKGGLETLTRALAVTLGPRVQVNAIAPGAILAPVGDDGTYFRRLAARIPARRTGSPEEIVRAMLYILDSRFVTGETITVDGGEHLV
jgi:pteridine reductase